MKSPIFQFILLLLLLSFTNCKVPVLVYENPNIHLSESGIFFFDDYTLDEKQFLSKVSDRIISENAFGDNGRKFVKRNWRALFANKKHTKALHGKIVIMVCANREGEMKYGEIISNESTLSDPNILKNALNASRGYRVEEDQNAPIEECGKLIFNLDINGSRS